MRTPLEFEILIRNHSFSFVVVEGDWPDATRVRRYIQSSESNSAREVLQTIHRWPRSCAHSKNRATVRSGVKSSQELS